jgi:lambda family phage portal protein
MKPKARQPARLAEARPNLLDRIIEWVAPGVGLTRRRDRAMLDASGGYRGGKRDRRATGSWTPLGGSADADLMPEVDDLRARSRDLARNVPIATGAISTQVVNVVGAGLSPRAAIDRDLLGLDEDQATEWERAAEREFALAAMTLDWSTRQVFEEMQALILRSVLESGDILVVRRWRRDPGDVYGTKLQLVEADRLSNPSRRADTVTLTGGVQVDVNGVPVAYHVSDRHPGDRLGATLTWRAIPARYRDGRPVCLHLYGVDRPDQTRGAPYLAPVIEDLKELGNYTEAEARAAVVAALYTVFVKTPDAGAEGGPAPATGGESAGTGDHAEMKLAPGAIQELLPGEDITIANPGRPNPAFDAFVTALLRQIGVGLDLPYELLVKHFTSSYSASRAALETAWQYFRVRRAWLARRLCDEVWEWVLEEAVATGRIDAPGFFADPAIREAWLGVEWIGAQRPSLDPKKDAEADQIDLGTGAKTLAQVTTERTGGDWQRKTRQRAKEVKLRRDLDLEAAPGAAPASGAAPAGAGADASADQADDSDQEQPT